jgi:DNA-binding GntR family transcriptional regulator
MTAANLGSRDPQLPDLFGEAAHLVDSEVLSERAVAVIEHDILVGVWQPGERLGVHALSSKYGIGATPVREGLSRLVSRSLVNAVGKRGFRVSRLSKDDLADITFVRTVVETRALSLSIANGGAEWEANIVASLHRLSRSVSQYPQEMREGTPEFDRIHKAFHRSLLQACGSERLLRIHDDLYYQAYRYRRVMTRGIVAHANFIKAHKRLADIVLARNEAAAMKELATHLSTTLEAVYPSKKQRREHA